MDKAIIFLSFLLFLSCARNLKEDSIQERSSTLTQTDNITTDNNIQAGNVIEGKVIRVDDGDTFELLIENNKTIKIRMEGIDAPERGMPYYRVAKNFLLNQISGETVKVEITDKGPYNRYIGLTYHNDKEMSAEMLREGMAWHFKKYNSHSHFAELEQLARENRVGLWEEENPVPPWIHRKLRPRGISTKDLREYSSRVFEITEKNQKISYKDVEVELNYSRSRLSLRIKKGTNSTQILELRSNEAPQQISIADYNMDEQFDFMILIDSIPHYYLYDSEQRKFIHHKEWDFLVWKLNKPKKQILTESKGTSYKGQAFLYQVQNDFEISLLEVINFD